MRFTVTFLRSDDTTPAVVEASSVEQAISEANREWKDTAQVGEEYEVTTRVRVTIPPTLVVEGI